VNDEKDFLKKIRNMDPDDPGLLFLLKQAKEKGYKEAIEEIAKKLGLKEDEEKEEKKNKRKRQNDLNKPVRLNKKDKAKGTWDYGVDFLDAKKKITDLYKKAYDMNDTIHEIYTAVLLIQLSNGLRVREAIDSFKRFIETGEREFYITAQKHNNQRYVVIPSVIKKKVTYNAVFSYDSKRLEQVIYHWCKKVFGVNTHSLRYAFITHLAENGVDPAIIAKITGHRKIDRIVTYTQTSKAIEFLKKVAD